jgi:regulator of sirC expression with transglutaminase-like and TPR domain
LNPDRTLDEFTQLVKGPEIDLGVAALAIARIEHPDLSPGPALAELDELAARSSVSSARGRRALDRLCSFLFEGEKFRGNSEDYYDPRNSCLNDVLDRRLGIPITLAVVVMEVGRRVGLDICGIGLPGHAEAIASRAVGRAVKLTDAHFVPTTRSQIVVRILRNLEGIYARREDWTKALAVIDRLLVVDADAPTHRRDRGTVLVKLGELHRGASEWERYLTRYPQARDAAAFREELRRVRQTLAEKN